MHILQVKVLCTSGHMQLKVFSCLARILSRQVIRLCYRLAVLKSLLFLFKVVNLKTIHCFIIYFLTLNERLFL